MKYLLSLFIFCGFGLGGFAQSHFYSDSSLTYQRFTKCEGQWVALARQDTAGRHAFGYIFIDPEVGFSFFIGGAFKVDKNQKYIADTMLKSPRKVIKIKPNWQKAAIISPQHLVELGVGGVPALVKPFYAYTDTARHNFLWGLNYNDVNEPAMALPYLQRSYQLNPDGAGIAYELGFSYNALNKYDEAIAVLTRGISLSSDNAFLYKQLGDAYGYKNENDKAISSYKLAIDHFSDKDAVAKGEAAFDLAAVYKKMDNTGEYKNWMKKAKDYSPRDSPYYKLATDAGF